MFRLIFLYCLIQFYFCCSDPLSSIDLLHSYSLQLISTHLCPFSRPFPLREEIVSSLPSLPQSHSQPVAPNRVFTVSFRNFCNHTNLRLSLIVMDTMRILSHCTERDPPHRMIPRVQLNHHRLLSSIEDLFSHVYLL